MKIKIFKFFVFGVFCGLLFCWCVQAGILDYDIASYYGQNSNWAQAKEKLKHVFVDRPSDPNILYDLAVASFETKDFIQAAEYFKSVIENEKASLKLKEQASFNLGNTNVELKNLLGAIENYEQVLRINPENKFARHNLEVVKKMLEQEKNKQENKQEQNKSQDDKKQDSEKSEQEKQQEQNKSDNQEKKEKQGQDNKKSGEKEDKQQDGDKNKSEDGSKKDQQNENGQDKNSANKSEDKQGQDLKSGGKDSEKGKNGSEKQGQEQQGQSRNDHSDKQEPVGKETQNTNHGKNDKVETEKNQAQAGDSKKDSEKSGQNLDKQKLESENLHSGQGKEQDLAEDNKQMSAELLPVEGAQKLDERTKRILQEVGNIDKQNSKEFMKATVRKDMSGKYGQNLW